MGKLKVAPASAPRLASDTVVAPLASSMVPAPDADSTPPVMDNGPLRVELLLTLNPPLTMDKVSFAAVVRLCTGPKLP